MEKSPEQISREVDETQARLAETVGELGAKKSHLKEDVKDAAKEKVAEKKEDLKDKVVEKKDELLSKAADKKDSVAETVSEKKEAVQSKVSDRRPSAGE